MTVLNYPGMPVKPGSMGRPLPGVDAAVLDERGRLRTRDARGRLLIRAPNPQLMLGYWNDPDRTAAQYVEVGGSRWFVTGDTVDVDEDGYLFYFGRDDDVIGSSGYRIGPQEVENALIEHPAVQESAVVGLPDPDRGQVVAAFVIPAPGFETGDALVAELQEHVRRITAPYKYPRRIEFVESLPKTVSGKIQRGVLRSMHAGHEGAPCRRRRRDRPPVRFRIHGAVVPGVAPGWNWERGRPALPVGRMRAGRPRSRIRPSPSRCPAIVSTPASPCRRPGARAPCGVRRGR